MNKGVLYFLVALSGGALGSALACYYTKKYYKQIADEEIESVKREFEPKKKSVKKEEAKERTTRPVQEQETIDTIKEYKNTVTNNYGGYFTKKEDKKVEIDPYVISPEDFDSIEGYGTVSLTYFADGYLVDEVNDELYESEDIAASVGEDFMNHIGEYEADSVHIRNDETETDYEILTDLRRYQDVLEDRRH